MIAAGISRTTSANPSTVRSTACLNWSVSQASLYIRKEARVRAASWSADTSSRNSASGRTSTPSTRAQPSGPGAAPTHSSP